MLAEGGGRKEKHEGIMSVSATAGKDEAKGGQAGGGRSLGAAKWNIGGQLIS